MSPLAADNLTNPVDATHSTHALQLPHESTTGVIPFEEDGSYQVRYRVGNRIVYLTDSFSAYLEALADAAAQNDPLKAEVFINAVSATGNVALNMHGVGEGRAGLTWSMLVKTLEIVWRELIINLHSFKEIDFELEHNGVKIGEGFIFRIGDYPSAS